MEWVFIPAVCVNVLYRLAQPCSLPNKVITAQLPLLICHSSFDIISAPLPLLYVISLLR